MAQTDTHVFRIALWDDKSVYRDIEIESGKSLYHLAQTIVRAFEFDFDHAFGFYSGRTERTLMSAQSKYELFADWAKTATPRASRGLGSPRRSRLSGTH